MPEELLIALVVVAGAGWVLFKLISALASGLGEGLKSISGAFAQAAGKRFYKKKSTLKEHIRIVLPSEIEHGERVIKSLEADFQRQKSRAVWKPQRPTWEKKHCKPLKLYAQNPLWRTMDIADLESILQPNLVAWSEIETGIISRDSSYPCRAPQQEYEEFRELSVPVLELQEAIFQTEPGVRVSDLDRFFGQERSEVEKYNRQRLAVLSRYKVLKEQIKTWNVIGRESWNQCIKAADAIAREELNNYGLHAKQYSSECNRQKENISPVLEGYRHGKREHVITRIQWVLGSLEMPGSVPRQWEIEFEENEHILIVELGLPDVVHRPPVKTVTLKGGRVNKPLNQTERREVTPKVHPAILLRAAFEIFRNDTSETVRLLVLNGWVSFEDPATGNRTKAYTSSLMVERQQIMSLNLQKIDPVAAFQNLKGKSAGRLIEIIPIEPLLALKRDDSRFVDGRAVLDTLKNASNLAIMDWQDFEHLIRELFEKEFSGRGTEVKITQASRDRGVDAIAFDPDPIHGGKYVIQAKRYTNTVDVSAVRDLCAVVRKEGASRGILVTTSTYGADAYAFANNEPVTLLTGAELLGLLRKHGYNFRIDLQEARRIHIDQERRTQSEGASRSV